MPELPEVETTRRGLRPLVVDRHIRNIEIRQRKLRWPIERGLAARVGGQRIVDLRRRGKYLLVELEHGALIVHLGMSGSLRFLPAPLRASKHDHFDVELDDGSRLRFHDPRRFGSLHYSTDPAEHPLLKSIGPEPLGDDFDTGYLVRCCRGRKAAIKQLLMNSRIVAGIGNIYANEALFRAKIHPARSSGRISAKRLQALALSVRDVLNDAIAQGGTTLRDFVGGDGRPGYFSVALRVYGRAGLPCENCGTPIRMQAMHQRASYYCPKCQR